MGPDRQCGGMMEELIEYRKQLNGSVGRRGKGIPHGIVSR